MFIVEDGTGTVSGANSYEATADLDSYCADRGIDLSAYTSQQKQQALVKVTDYIDIAFGPRFKGIKLLSTQPLRFPRALLTDPDSFCYTLITGIPIKLKYACSEYAIRELASPGSLLPDPVVDDTGMEVTSTLEKVGPIEEHKTFSSGSLMIFNPYPKADRYLYDFIVPNGGSSRA